METIYLSIASPLFLLSIYNFRCCRKTLKRNDITFFSVLCIIFFIFYNSLQIYKKTIEIQEGFTYILGAVFVCIVSIYFNHYTRKYIDSLRKLSETIENCQSSNLKNEIYLDKLLRNHTKENNVKDEKLIYILVNMNNIDDIYNEFGYEIGKIFKLNSFILFNDFFSDCSKFNTGFCIGGKYFLAVMNNNQQSYTSVLTFIEHYNNSLFETELGIFPHNLNVGVSTGGFFDLKKKIDEAILAVHVGKLEKQSIYYFNDFIDKNLLINANIHKKMCADDFFEQLYLCYQPICNSRTREIQSFECLLRWVNNGEFISPDKFIPIAVQCGMITDITIWVFNKVKNDIDLGLCKFPVSINISIDSLSSNKLINFLYDFSSYNLPVKIEITESGNFDYYTGSESILNILTNLGFDLILDDFMKGDSKLEHLLIPCIKQIKIDKSYIDEICINKKSRLILSSLCELTHNLGMSLVAEGVETNEQLFILRSLGVDYCQGYLLYRPQTIFHFN